MKRLYSLLIILPLLLLSCSSESQQSPKGEGALRIVGAVNADWDKIEAATRATAESIVGYTLSVVGENSSFKHSEVVAEDGSVVIEAIPAGLYTVSLQSHPEGMGDPEFESPIYGETITGVKIAAGETRELSMECTQANSGVYFVFDPALIEAGFGELIPTIADSEQRALSFGEKSDREIEGELKTASRVGHFGAGEVTLTLKNGEQVLTIGGKQSQTLTFEAKQLWEVTLKPKATTKGGSLEVIATVEVIKDPTHREVFEIGGSADTPNYELYPLTDQESVYVDTALELTFGSAPAVGAEGTIAIYKTDGTLVDRIDLSDSFVPRKGSGESSTMVDAIGVETASNGGRVRWVNYYPVVVDGNSIRIKPHSNVLEYNTEYYITIEKSAIVHEEFSGVGEGEWKFTTKAAAPTLDLTTIKVGRSEGADFATIQAAIDHAGLIGKDEAVTIEVENGLYEELLFMRGKNNLTIRGESREGVRIVYDNCDELNGGTGGSNTGDQVNGGRAIFLVESSGGLRLENLTMENTHQRTGKGDQAETIYFNCTSHTLVVVNCNLISKQDTANIKGYSWFYNSTIAGDVDYIWGSPVVALFEECEIRSVSSEGYLVQSRAAELDKGFVFLNCTLTKESGVASGKTYLARSAHESKYYDNIAFVNCRMDSHIAPEGWVIDPGQSSNPAVATLESGWKEYGTLDMAGAPLNLSNRLTDVHYILSEAEVETHYKDRATIMEDYANNTGKSLDWIFP